MVNAGFGRNRFSFDFRHLGSADNYSQFENDGTLVFNGDATVWDDLRVPVTSTRVGGNDPGFAQIADDGSGSRGVFTYLFDAAGDEELFFIAQMPHSYKIGSNIEAHVHWCPTAGTTVADQVSWGLEYAIKDIGGTIGDTTIAYGDTPTVGNAALVDKKHYLTEIAELDMSAVTGVSAAIIGRIFRDATATGGTDSYASDAALLEMDFHYEIDTIGSRGEYTK